ncbi:MAG TPA: metal ABC transporter substrate-binding protein [Candidatus Eisenbergiella merdipullorum]|uniref:Metal ABC transporter substrate-binding protein n=1 Tax=Candidatus Eisenbergiella merdipullorum TaxID=2838553 RepID=A0A9D2I660_9FIRM|nr:metal ABC transporter substrate-binding protein [Candidatus Eisenbergiella merdipullorum]
MKQFHQLLLLSLTAGLILTGCSAIRQDVQPAPDGKEKVEVVTTIFPPFDFVRQIGGEYVEVTQLLKPGMEAHSYEPSPADILRITDSDLFLYAGGESDVWVEEILEGSDSQVAACSLLSWVEPLEEETAEGMQVTGHHHEHGEEETDGVHLEETEYDEHVWTSPVNAQLLVENIRDMLISIDPDSREIYEENAAAYLEELQALDADYRRVVDNAKRKVLVFGDRFPFLYLVRTYGLEYYAAFPGCSGETEPSAATIAFLTDKVREEQIPIVFHLELSNGKVADAIAEVAGAETATLHSCHTLTRQEAEKGETYLSLMRKNLAAIERALNEGEKECL